ncbi:hypothetical protein [Chryseobacterium soli]|nr:hypothetical protein [Chryseobacterium soli]
MQPYSGNKVMKTALKNNSARKHTIAIMMMDCCMPVFHDFFCG